jgi:putative ATPase
VSDLFSAAADDALARRAPLADRLRPRTLDEVVGQDHLLAPGRPLRALVDADRLQSVLLWGPPGTGKTTLAQLIAAASSADFVALSAVNASVKDVRETVASAKARLGERGRRTILFLDEIHRFNKSQQDALLPAVESGLLVLVGATTENPSFEVNAALMSRSVLFRLRPLDADALGRLLDRGLAALGLDATDEARAHLVASSGGDGRSLLTTLEVAGTLAAARTPTAPPAATAATTATAPTAATAATAPTAPTAATAATAPTVATAAAITLADTEGALDARRVRYGVDDHYDVISAFIKSIRGSDPDAALHWLARMLEAGESPRFIARRLVIAASEDIGMADPMALVVADAAAHAVEFVGLPEARINLAQATVHLAVAPKSNRSYLAIDAAIADVRRGGFGEVPSHLRDASSSAARRADGAGAGYRYPHDHPGGWVEQAYLPEALRDRTYYEPSDHGAEARLAERWRERRRTT